jgi:hypothetical protein
MPCVFHQWQGVWPMWTSHGVPVNARASELKRHNDTMGGRARYHNASSQLGPLSERVVVPPYHHKDLVIFYD